MVGIAPDQPEISINGVLVSFFWRDVRLVSDQELITLEELVRTEREIEGPNRVVEKIVVESSFLDRDLIRYKTTVRVRQEVNYAQEEGATDGE